MGDLSVNPRDGGAVRLPIVSAPGLLSCQACGAQASGIMGRAAARWWPIGVQAMLHGPPQKRVVRRRKQCNVSPHFP